VAFVVEDGTGVVTANSYVTLAAALLYHGDRQNAAWADVSATDALRQAALIRATSYIDATYRLRFSGLRTFRRNQALEWPRIGAFVHYPDANLLYVQEQQGYGYAYWNYDFIPNNIVPAEIVKAACEGALRELAEPGSLAPDLERNNAIRSLKAGPVIIHYAGDATPNTVFQAIDIALASLLAPSSPYSSRASRG